MTGNEIIKSLKHCEQFGDCETCPLKNNSEDCKVVDDYLVQLHSKIESIMQGDILLSEFYFFAKKRAIKEFLIEFKKRCIKGGIYPLFVAKTAENIAEEMAKERRKLNG